MVKPPSSTNNRSSECPFEDRKLGQIAAEGSVEVPGGGTEAGSDSQVTFISSFSSVGDCSLRV